VTGGRPKKALKLTEEERRSLLRWAKRPKSTQRLALRCRIVLACAEGLSNKEVARRLRVTASTVSKWRERFRVGRLGGLSDRPRSGAPRKVTEKKVREVISKTMEAPPTGAAQWSTRQIAREVGLSQTTVLRIWRAQGLEPGRRVVPAEDQENAQAEKVEASRSSHEARGCR